MVDDKINELPQWKRDAVFAEIKQSQKTDPVTLCRKHGITMSNLLEICGVKRRPTGEEREPLNELSIDEALELINEWNAPLALIGIESD